MYIADRDNLPLLHDYDHVCDNGLAIVNSD